MFVVLGALIAFVTWIGTHLVGLPLIGAKFAFFQEYAQLLYASSGFLISYGFTKNVLISILVAVIIGLLYAVMV